MRGARVAFGPLESRRVDLEICGGKISAIGKSIAGKGIDLAGHLILPGLINAHDHLSFNLFPLLGRPPYPNAGAWARDVYQPAESPVREHRSVPRNVRLAWGAIKNLVSGVTTVAHHDPDQPDSFSARFPVKVAKCGWAHSLEFTPDTIKRFRSTPKGRPFILHLGEGTDDAAAREIFTLDRMGLLGPRTVIVHGVAIDSRGLDLVRKRGASLIACPVSNLFTLGRTLKPSVFSRGIPVALATDSALTATGDLLDALRAARGIWKLSATKLYRMVTEDAARVLRLRDGEGHVRGGGVADLIVVKEAVREDLRDHGRSPAESLLHLRGIEMSIVAGRIRMVSHRFARFAKPSFQPITIEGRGGASRDRSIYVDADVAALYRETVPHLGPKFKLAGRRLRAIV